MFLRYYRLVQYLSFYVEYQDLEGIHINGDIWQTENTTSFLLPNLSLNTADAASAKSLL